MIEEDEPMDVPTKLPKRKSFKTEQSSEPEGTALKVKRKPDSKEHAELPPISSPSKILKPSNNSEM